MGVVNRWLTIGWATATGLASLLTVVFVLTVVISLPAKHEEGLILMWFCGALLVFATPAALLRPRPIFNAALSTLLMSCGFTAVWIRVSLHYGYGVFRSDYVVGLATLLIPGLVVLLLNILSAGVHLLVRGK